MMTKIIKNLASARVEIKAIEDVERDFLFLKKQILAHEIEEVMREGEFLEAKYIGVIDDNRQVWLKNGYYFDAKTAEKIIVMRTFMLILHINLKPTRVDWGYR